MFTLTIIKKRFFLSVKICSASCYQIKSTKKGKEREAKRGKEKEGREREVNKEGKRKRGR